MSWLAAARKRVLERLASSAAVLARASFAVEPLELGGALATRALQPLVGGGELLLGLTRFCVTSV